MNATRHDSDPIAALRGGVVRVAWHVLLTLVVPGVAMCVGHSASARAADEPTAEEFFEKKVRPGPGGEPASAATGRRSRRAGCGSTRARPSSPAAESGPAVVPGDPAKSLLIEAVRRQGELKMPPDGPLDGRQIAALTRWVELGAPWPADRRPRPVATPAAGPLGVPAGRRPAAAGASVTPAGSARPIDAFVLAKLEAEGLTPSPPADRRTLIRRVDLRPDRPAADAGGGRGVRRRTSRPTRTPSWSTGCSPARTTASTGAGTGSTSPATPTPRVTSTPARSGSGSTPGPIATG